MSAQPRHRRRQIADVLVRHAWASLLTVTGLNHCGSVDGGPTHHEGCHTPAEHLRLAFEELGPTFIKLGQALSTRPDLLAPEYQVELAKLQDASPSLPAKVVHEVIAAELDGALERSFASFDVDPLAAASIGQAHAATLSDGTDVVVKIRRPGAVEQVEQDLEIIKNAAAYASRHWESADLFDVVGLAEEFAQNLRAQLDYLHEARNAERFASNFEGDPDVHIPKVFWETTTSRIITLERIRGMKVTDLASLAAAGIDRHRLATRATNLVAKMVFEHGFFHADPHPGNFFIQPDGQIGVIDFGIVGTLDDHLREQLLKFLIALIRRDPERLAAAVVELSASPGSVDQAELQLDLADFLERYADPGLVDVKLGTMIGDVLEIIRRNSLRVRHDLALLVKTFIIAEGIADTLDPQFDLLQALRPHVYREIAAQLTPGALVRRLERTGIGLAELVVDLPAQAHRILEAMASGGIQIHLRAQELDPLVARIERAGKRIAASMLGAAAINGVIELAAAYGAGATTRRSRRLSALLGAVGIYASVRALR
jgi:ubiquinone biosynthesis protein